MTKGLEALSRIESFIGYNYCSTDLPNEMAILSKELKALEIIKNKQVDADVIISKDTYLDWLDYYGQDLPTYMWLTQEEFKLLKEVLCDE